MNKRRRFKAKRRRACQKWALDWAAAIASQYAQLIRESA